MKSKRLSSVIRSLHSSGRIPIENVLLLDTIDNLHASYFYQISELSRIVFTSGTKQSNSFTKGFAQLLYRIGFYAGASDTSVSITNTAGAGVSSFTTLLGSLNTTAPITNTNYGLLVGTGITAESINDTALVTKIAHGTSAGQIQYGTMTFGAPSTTATTTTFRFTRVFTNGSGGAIGVEEFGLAGENSNLTNRFLLLRDITGTITVNNGQALTLNLDFTTTI